MPNGLVRGRDGLIYVPSTLDGTIRVFNLSENHHLLKVNEIKVPLPVDNLSVDNKGDIYAAAFPKVYMWGESSKDPFNVNPPTAVFRIRKSVQENESERKSHLEMNAEYIVEKVVEDDGSVLPGSTTVVHDAETRRIFLSGIMSPYMAICEPTA
jgi:arylesterase / paraoxonase